MQIIHIFPRYFAYLLCGPYAARRHSEAHPTGKIRFLLNMLAYRFAKICFLLERGVLFHKYAILMHIRTKGGRKANKCTPLEREAVCCRVKAPNAAAADPGGTLAGFDGGARALAIEVSNFV